MGNTVAVEVANMLAAAWLMLSSLFYSLQLSSGSFPRPLTEEEERYYLDLAGKGDLEARNVLIERNLRLVAHIMKKYYSQSADQEDLISIGTIGLIKAVNTFNSGKKIKLATYASRCIENEILMTLRASRKRRGDVSLSDPVGSDGEGNDITYQDILGTDADELENTVIRRVTAGKVQQVLHRLPARERFVLELRYGLTDGRQHPQHEIARRLGISRSYVSRVEKKAVALLRDEIERE